MKNKQLIAFVFLGLVFGQTHNQINASIKTAKLLQRKGDLDGAISIYEDILGKNPGHSQTFRALKTLYKKNQMYADGILLIRGILAQQPNNPQLYSELGEFTFLKGDVPGAKAVWSAGHALFNRNRSWYRTMVNLYGRYGLDDEMESLLIQGRSTFGKTFMTYEAGNYYQTRRVYDKAMDQYILHLSHQPKQNGVILRRILNMSDELDAVDIIEKKLKSSTNSNPVVLNVLSEFYFKQGEYDLAYETKIQRSEMAPPNLGDWLDFGKQLRQEYQFEKAVDAFNFILKQKGNKTIQGKALLGLAQTFEDQIIPINESNLIPYFFDQNSFFSDPFHYYSTISTSHLESTVSLYDSLLTTLPKTTLLADALYRLGNIQFRIVQDFDQALVLFQQALLNRPEKKLKLNIILRIADVYIAKGDGEGALGFLNKKIKRNPLPAIEQKRLLVHFLSDHPDSTLKIVQESFLKMSPVDPAFNDVMELKNILTQYYENDSKHRSAFQHFTKAEWYIRQRKLGDAIRELNYLSEQDSAAAVTPLAQLREALLHYRLQDYETTLGIALSLQKTPLADRGIILAGQIFETKFLDIDKALEQYMTILDHYPNSIFSEPIRYHIRSIQESES